MQFVVFPCGYRHLSWLLLLIAMLASQLTPIYSDKIHCLNCNLGERCQYVRRVTPFDCGEDVYHCKKIVFSLKGGGKDYRKGCGGHGDETGCVMKNVTEIYRPGRVPKTIDASKLVEHCTCRGHLCNEATCSSLSLALALFITLCYLNIVPLP